GLSSLPPVIYYSEQLFSRPGTLFTDWLAMHEKPVAVLLIKMVTCLQNRFPVIASYALRYDPLFIQMQIFEAKAMLSDTPVDNTQSG
ncbi:hypothetical protein ACHMWS_20785, partial [Aeromonas caviae]|uniref:hypothetical protein n=2 Tax=Aeromonas caviae TaxID=648 RepID=UPI0037552BA1